MADGIAIRRIRALTHCHFRLRVFIPRAAHSSDQVRVCQRGLMGQLILGGAMVPGPAQSANRAARDLRLLPLRGGPGEHVEAGGRYLETSSRDAAAAVHPVSGILRAGANGESYR
jgi:hypothetical protein